MTAFGMYPGQARGEARQLGEQQRVIKLPVPEAAHPAEIIYWVIATIKNVLMCVVLVIVLIVGHRVIAAIGQARQELGTFQDSPADAPLPTDRCGGGLC